MLRVYESSGLARGCPPKVLSPPSHRVGLISLSLLNLTQNIPSYSGEETGSGGPGTCLGYHRLQWLAALLQGSSD